MKCDKCKNDFEERELDSSHDIPKYLGGTDIDGRHWLCKKCHEKYELTILQRCVEFVGEEFIPEEKIIWMIELKKQPEKLKEEFRFIAKMVQEDFFK